jgi:hypothetical protein
MRRCIFEYKTNNKKSISTEDGKKFIGDIFKALEIEKIIKTTIQKSNCKIDKHQYSQNLISAIDRMYEVN